MDRIYVVRAVMAFVMVGFGLLWGQFELPVADIAFVLLGMTAYVIHLALEQLLGIKNSVGASGAIALLSLMVIAHSFATELVPGLYVAAGFLAVAFAFKLIWKK